MSSICLDRDSEACLIFIVEDYVQSRVVPSGKAEGEQQDKIKKLTNTSQAI